MKEFGRYVLFLESLVVRRETFITYYRLVMEECVQIGVKSISLFVLVSTFMGAVTTVQTAFNLVTPLVPRFVISQVVREMTVLELAPTIMAIIFAGKIGSSMAGGLGTMRITEQIDALEVMGINSSSYLVLPKIIASILMYPMLVIFAGTCSLLGGYLVGTLTGIMTPTEYIMGLRSIFNQYTITFALIKSVVFAFLISSISCYKGYYTHGGALEVGIASTEAVTSSVIAVLLADYFLANLLL
ncbi:MAG: ABC transporter permease [Cytophagales bacterium]|jgi:phospholipid/cholesterol/gamma-HCH transport system permease protein|nr:ABC transporter permease [Cytophagales bacterium]MCA6388475.1 ABC transporter permease [Cytophagales bacterium]MCA6390900.1 ABC transporter permease [Cytophagales bacterium]MCA6394875.1 ABC transporter permease [Cytophagales bacterium]MCA6399088.1 ABC transporter permease [Cytophagales bacterium]